MWTRRKRLLHRSWLSAPLVLAALTGCGADNSLSGSVGELFSLDISQVHVLRNSEAIQVSYFNNRGADIDLVVQVTVDIAGVNISSGTSINLDGEYQPGHQRTTVIHAAAGEPIRRLPPVKQGDLKITKNGNSGEQMKGNFSMSFGSGGDLGEGRTLVGSFAGTVADAGFGP